MVSKKQFQSKTIVCFFFFFFFFILFISSSTQFNLLIDGNQRKALGELTNKQPLSKPSKTSKPSKSKTKPKWDFEDEIEPCSRQRCFIIYFICCCIIPINNKQ